MRVGWCDEWSRFRPWEYAYTAVALGTGFTLRFVVENPPANWRGGILFDDFFVERMALENLENRRLAEWYGDVFFYGSLVYRAVDSLIVPLVGYSDSDLALQMSMIDLEAFGTVALVLWGSQALVRRERPRVTPCDAALGAENSNCDPAGERNRSFIAGHVAVAFTAAGLTCMHHAHIPLYGGVADTIACGSTIGAAGMVGLARLWTQAHYPSDLVLGYALGAFAGWLMPAALHYGFRRSTTRGARIGRRQQHSPRFASASVVPFGSGQGLGIGVIGIF